MLKNSALEGVKSFAIFYGFHGEKDLSDYDLLILEPEGHNPLQIGIYKSKGKIPIAYQSIIEAHEGQSYFLHFDEADYIIVDGKRLTNEEYGTYFLNISSKRVQNIIFNAIEAHFTKGFEGIFLDTLGNLDYIVIEENYRERLLVGAKDLLWRVKNKYPDKIIIQNNGLAYTLDYTFEYIDAICFENPPIDGIKQTVWTISVFEKLKRLEKVNGIKALVAVEENTGFSFVKSFVLRQLIKKHKFLFYQAPRYYK